MKVLHKISWHLLALSGVVCFAPAQAADAVYQRTANDGAIELSNIAEADAGQVAVTVDNTPQSGAKPGAATTGPASQARQTAPARGKASAEEDPNATVAEACTERELADALTKEAKEACEKKKLARAEAATPGTSTASNYSAESGGGFSYGASPVASNSGSGGSTSTGGGSNTGTGTGTTSGGGSGTGTGSSSGTGTTAGTGTGTGSGTPTASVVTPRTDTGTGTPATAAPTVTANSGLASNLQNYRQMMVNEAAAANINDNHAVSRRYLMTNRGSYQTAIGVTP
jgi:hypothetical protein